MRRAIKGLSIAALAIACAPSVYAACAAPLYGYTIDSFNSNTPSNPPLDYPVGGSGIAGDFFSACEDSDGLQIGLRVRERFAAYTDPGDSDVYLMPIGAHTDGNPLWGFDFHVDMGYDYGTGIAPVQIGDLDSLVLQIDCEPAIGVVNGPAVDLTKLTPFYPILFGDEARLIQVTDNIGFPLRCPGMAVDPDAPGAYEFSFTAMHQGSEIGQATATALIGEPPTVPAPTDSAAFTVIKAYSDLNESAVTVDLTCNGGLPLQQDFDIVPVYVDDTTNQVSFTLTNPTAGTSCTVSETNAPAGYEVEYIDISGTGTVDENGCHYTDVAPGTSVVCGVVNRSAAVDVTVTKVWELIDDFSASSNIEMVCSNVVSGTQDTWNWSSASSVEGGSEDFVAAVSPLADGSTSCAVTETNSSSAVMVSGCEAPISVDVGDTDAGCTLTNTIFFEGVPTLNQYTIALLVLLMAGIGFVGIRRIA